MPDEKMDKIMDKLAEISERIVRVETMLTNLRDDSKVMKERLTNHEGRIQKLEQHKTQVVNSKDIFTWLAMAVIAIMGVMMK